MYRNVVVADHYPLIESLFAGPLNTIWVRRTSLDSAIQAQGEEHDESTSDWDIFESSGQYLGSLQLPSNFFPRKSAGRYVYGVVRDEYGVEYLSKRSLEGLR
jgi:hypothetical protein